MSPLTPERILAAALFAVCVVLLLRLAIGSRRRARVDAAARRAVQALRRIGSRAWRWRAERRAAERARVIADEAIRRARERGEWDGNVYRPKSFRKPPRDKMH